MYTLYIILAGIVYRLAVLKGTVTAWWSSFRKWILQLVIFYRRVIRPVMRYLNRMLFLAIAMHVLCIVVPELPARIPTIYAILEGWITVVETIFRTVFKAFWLLISRHPILSLKSFGTAISELITMFAMWLANL